eukprot:scaffold7039_cov255-Pinguiococcus_pyrenoidosus.AAC.13
MDDAAPPRQRLHHPNPVADGLPIQVPLVVQRIFILAALSAEALAREVHDAGVAIDAGLGAQTLVLQALLTVELGHGRAVVPLAAHLRDGRPDAIELAAVHAPGGKKVHNGVLRLAL